MPHKTYFKKKPEKKENWQRGLKARPLSNFRLIPKPSKMKNQSCSCFARHSHDSIHEANVCNRLWARTKLREIKGYRVQKTYPLYVKKKHICDHRVDFEVVNNDGSIEIWEAKGYGTPEWRIKHNLFLAVYPKILYKVIAEYIPKGGRLSSIKGLVALKRQGER